MRLYARKGTVRAARMHRFTGMGAPSTQRCRAGEANRVTPLDCRSCASRQRERRVIGRARSSFAAVACDAPAPSRPTSADTQTCGSRLGLSAGGITGERRRLTSVAHVDAVLDRHRALCESASTLRDLRLITGSGHDRIVQAAPARSRGLNALAKETGCVRCPAPDSRQQVRQLRRCSDAGCRAGHNGSGDILGGHVTASFMNIMFALPSQPRGNMRRLRPSRTQARARRARRYQPSRSRVIPVRCHSVVWNDRARRLTPDAIIRQIIAALARALADAAFRVTARAFRHEPERNDRPKLCPPSSELKSAE